MRALPSWTKKVIGVLALLALVLIAFGAVFYHQLTAPVHPRQVERPSLWDLDEAKRKIKLFEEAKALNRRGFVRLSETELNAFLGEREEGEDIEEKEDGADSLAAGESDPEAPEFVRIRVALGNEHPTFYTWIRRNWLGKQVEIVWQRTAALHMKNGEWTMETQSMRIGQVDIPRRFWNMVEGAFASVDEQLAHDFGWVKQVPALDIALNKNSQNRELRFYTYPVPEGWLEAQR